MLSYQGVMGQPNQMVISYILDSSATHNGNVNGDYVDLTGMIYQHVPEQNHPKVAKYIPYMEHMGNEFK